MTLVLLLCLGLPLAAICMLTLFSPRFGKNDASAHISSLLFALWLVSTVLFSPFTFALQFGGLPDISIERVVLTLTIGAAIVRLYRRDLLHGQDKTLELLMFLFCLVCLVAMARFGFMAAHLSFQKPSFVFMSGYLIPFLAFAFAKYFLEAERDLLIVFKAVFWLGAYLSVMAFLERSEFKYLVWPPYVVDPEVTAMHLDRARGPFLNAAFNGVAINIALICGLLVLPRLGTSKRWLYITVMVLMLPAIFLTHTRSVYVHFLLTLAGLMALYQTRTAKWRFLPMLLLGAFLVVAVNLETLTSGDRESGGIGQMKEVYIRLGLAEKSLNLLSEHPIGGIGLAQFRSSSLFTPSEVELQHNQLIGMAVELGLPGVLLYLAILLTIFSRLYALADYIPVSVFFNPNMVLLLALALFVCLWNAVFVEPSMHVFMTAIFFVFAGIVDQLYNRYVLRKII